MSLAPNVSSADMIIDEFDKKALKAFTADFLRIVEMWRVLDAQLGDVSSLLKQNEPIFLAYCKKFNLKYKGLRIQPSIDSIRGIELEIFFLNESSPQEVFKNVVHRMQDLSEVGESCVRLIPTQDTAKMMKKAEAMKDSVYCCFKDHTAIILTKNPKYDLVELCYNREDLSEPLSPQFKLCAYFALHEGYEEELDLQGVGCKFVGSVRTRTRKFVHSSEWDSHFDISKNQ